MTKRIQSIFRELQHSNQSEGNLYSASLLPNSSSHKLGITEFGAPVFFIKSPLLEHCANIKLDLISVLFNQSCRLKLRDILLEDNGVYTVVILKTNNPELGAYFINIIGLVLSKIGDTPDSKVLITELNKLVELFRCLTNPSKKTIQGLWAELFVIEQSKDPEYLIKSWHSEINDIYDFNDGLNKIEVKSTCNTTRKHHFSLKQLNPSDGAYLLICSVFVMSSGSGVTLFDLMKSIEKRVQALDLRFRLNEIISKTLGSDLEKAMDFYFDYQQALDSYQIYNYKEIPCIENKLIPNELSNVHFECDITNVNPITNLLSVFPSSKLFKAISYYGK
ncbi:PD-(D/E)XK motif protein [Porphyromonas levii]|uniref:PD-(D/E)XK motif protein n=1 Tax=Porphyromonas levii TaxID=28114 RepID=UPI001B8B8A26|nr:PD-(D/E)XK motif protein [Porphyromonas levii]MBR8769884.1 hypothetical protein [Porphyromonas levii]